MQVNVQIETPDQADVRALVAALNAHLQPLSSPEFQFGLTFDEVATPHTVVFVARDDTGAALGCVALSVHDSDFGEVKRMYTAPATRGQGVGSRLLDALIAHARAVHLRWLALETGVGDAFQPAWRLYERKGFNRRGPFLDYPDSGWSAFFELRLRSPVRRKAYGGSPGAHA